MSQLPPDVHTACAAGCTATAICPAGQCAKAGQAEPIMITRLAFPLSNAQPVAVVQPYGATVRLDWASVEAAHNAKPGPLYAAPGAALPPGWKLVPVEPTEAMTKAAVEAICYGPEGGFTRIAGPGRCWKVMLDAAPIPPAALLTAERECCGTFEGSEHRATCELQALRGALERLLKAAKRANEIMLHEAGIGVIDMTPITDAEALLAREAKG